MSQIDSELSKTGSPVDSPNGEVSLPLPKVTEVGIAALVFVVIGGIYLSAYYPRRVSLVLPSTLAIIALLLVIVNFVMIVLSTNLNKNSFSKVFRWGLLAYVLIAGMLEYVFIYDGTRGTALGILSMMLVVFAVDVPTIIAFTVARFQDNS